MNILYGELIFLLTKVIVSQGLSQLLKFVKNVNFFFILDSFEEQIIKHFQQKIHFYLYTFAFFFIFFCIRKEKVLTTKSLTKLS